MIEKKIFREKVEKYAVEQFVQSALGKLSCSSIEVQRTPLGERITVYTSKPGLIVGRKGANIRLLTQKLKDDFGLEDPQIEVAEISNHLLDARSVAKELIESFMRHGAKRFKVLAYQTLERVMNAGAKGVEVVVSGRGLPGVRAKTWRFIAGYLKKSGSVSETLVDKAIEAANLHTGTVGVQVRILRPDVVLPDSVIFSSPKEVDTTLVVSSENEVAVLKEHLAEKEQVVSSEAPKKASRRKVKKEQVAAQTSVEGADDKKA